MLFPLIHEALEGLGVRCKASTSDPSRLRIGGYDNRKVIFKGTVIVEAFSKNSLSGSFVIMSREEVRDSNRSSFFLSFAPLTSERRVTRCRGGSCGRHLFPRIWLNLMCFGSRRALFLHWAMVLDSYRIFTQLTLGYRTFNSQMTMVSDGNYKSPT